MSEQDLILESQLLFVRQDDDKNWWLRGIFGKADNVGKNSRCYPKAVLEAAVAEYIRDKVLPGAAYGTLDHEPSVSVSLKESAIRITRLWWEGDDLMGEAIVLDTEQGRNLQAILETGGTVGVSTRGSGVQNKDGTISNYRISSVDVVSQPANTGGQFVAAVYEDERPVNRTDNIDGLNDGNVRRRRRSKLARILSRLNRMRPRGNTVNVNPRLKEPKNDPAAHSSAARTTHPSKRGNQGMKEAFPNTDGKRYLSPDSKVPTTKGKPKHLRPKGSKKGMLETADADALHESLGGVLKAVSMAVADNQLSKSSALYRTAKVAFKGYKAYQQGKPPTTKNTNLPRSPTQVLSKGTTNMPKRESVQLRTPEVEAREALLMSWQNKDSNPTNTTRDEMIGNIIDAQEKLNGVR